MKSLVFLSLSVALMTTVQAATLQDTIQNLKSQPYSTAVKNNNVIFNKYCVGNPESADIPQPNYENELVKIAAAKISETKVKSNEALKKIALLQVEGSIESAKTSASDLSQSVIPDIASIGKKLLAEVNKASTTTGFTEETTSLVKQLSKSYYSVLKQSIETLNKELPKELKGVDYQGLAKIVQSLATLIKQQYKPVDLKKLKNVVTALNPQFEKNLVPPDYNKIKTYFQIVEAELAQATDSNLKHAYKSISATLKKYDAIVSNPDEVWMIQNTGSDIGFYISQYNEKNSGSPLSKQLVETVALIDSEIAKSDAEYYKKLAKDFSTALDNAIKNPTQQNDVEYLATDIYSIMQKTLGASDAKTKSLLQEMKLEVDKFSWKSIAETAAAAQNSIKNKDNPSLLDNAQSLSYGLANIESSLNKSTIALYQNLKTALLQSESANILASVKEASELFSDSNFVISEDNQYMISSPVYQLDEISKTLQKATQATVAQFKAAVAAMEAEQLINSTLKSNPEKVDSDHYYFYGDVRKIYGLNKNSVSSKAPQGTKAEAHLFLTQLCGEFRDRATMIEAKLNWLKNIFILEGNKTEFTIDPSKNVWSQIPASAYYPYLAVTQSVWAAKRENQNRFITIGDYAEVDTPVDGFTVCETKYIFSEYVGKDKAFEDFASYINDYNTYKVATGNCSQADLDDYYDFRGDSNFKHYSPESNGMIWYATTMAKACSKPNEVKTGVTAYTNQDCENYFKQPFNYRYNAARAGLATWLFRDDQYKDTFSSQGSMVAIYPHTSPGLAPFSFSFDNSSTEDIFGYDASWMNIPGAWNSADIGFNAFTGLGTNSANFQVAYERIRDAVDRHTDWYSSGFNDKNGTVKDQAYSPFVASSYEMSSSDAFTTCGITVPCPPDGLKRWMFIFRIKGKNWYNTSRILKNEPVDFDKMWFDETSFGVSGLADSEHAWDRLGTAMEDELDSILYLIGVDHQQSGEEGGE